MYEILEEVDQLVLSDILETGDQLMEKYEMLQEVDQVLRISETLRKKGLHVDEGV